MPASAFHWTLLGGCLLSSILKTVDSQAFLVTLTATPDKDIPLGSTVNLTCSFLVGKPNFRAVQFFDDSNVIFNYTDGSSGDWPDVEAYGSALSDDPAVDSVVWMTFRASLCSEISPDRTFKCEPHTKDDLSAQSDVRASYALPDPVRVLTIDGKEVCQSGTHNLDITNNPQKIKIAVSDESSNITNLALKIGEDTFDSLSFENTTDVCTHNAEVEAEYTFTENKDYIIKYSYLTPREPVEKSCTVTVEGGSSTSSPAKANSTAPTNDTDSEGGGMSGTAIALCCVMITAFCLGVIMVFALKKKKVSAKEPSA